MSSHNQPKIRPLRLFYSYSHKDERYRKELEKRLKPLRRKGRLEDWHDRRIGAGEEWKGKIDDSLEASDMILLLVSPDFIDSDYCYDKEMLRAMEKHEAKEARVIPIILRPVRWQDEPFSKLQALPTDGRPLTTYRNRDVGWLIVYDGIRTAIDQVTQAL